MSQQEEVVIIGRIGSAHGLKGFVKVQSFSESLEQLLNYQPWLIKQGKQWVEFPFDTLELHSKQIIVQPQNSNDRTTAQQYTNLDIGIYQSQLATLSDDEFYWNELVGMQVTNQDGVAFGAVKNLLATGSNDVLIVEDQEKKQRLIPYLPEEFVLKVDRVKKEILVNWDENF